MQNSKESSGASSSVVKLGGFQVKCADLQRHLTVGHFRQEISRTSHSAHCETSFFAGSWNAWARGGFKRRETLEFVFFVIWPLRTIPYQTSFPDITRLLSNNISGQARGIQVNIIEARLCYSVANPSFPAWVCVQKMSAFEASTGFWGQLAGAALQGRLIRNREYNKALTTTALESEWI